MSILSLIHGMTGNNKCSKLIKPLKSNTANSEDFSRFTNKGLKITIKI